MYAGEKIIMQRLGGVVLNSLSSDDDVVIDRMIWGLQVMWYCDACSFWFKNRCYLSKLVNTAKDR